MKITNIEIKNLDPIKTIAISHVGDYASMEKTFEKLGAWAATNNLWGASPKVAGVYHDDPKLVPTDILRADACIEDISGVEPGEGMHHYTITGGKYFVMQFEVTMSEYPQAWDKVYATFNEKGYEYDLRDHFELYGACADDPQNPDAPWIVDLCIPMK